MKVKMDGQKTGAVRVYGGGDGVGVRKDASEKKLLQTFFWESHQTKKRKKCVLASI